MNCVLLLRLLLSVMFVNALAILIMMPSMLSSNTSIFRRRVFDTVSFVFFASGLLLCLLCLWLPEFRLAIAYI